MNERLSILYRYSEFAVQTTVFSITAFLSRIKFPEQASMLLGGLDARVRFEHSLEAAAFILIGNSLINISAQLDSYLDTKRGWMLIALSGLYGIAQLFNELQQSVSNIRELQIDQLVSTVWGIGVGFMAVSLIDLIRKKQEKSVDKNGV